MEGISMSVINVENNSPEIMTTASGLWYPLDDPVDKERIRPIFMTTLTTVGGMIPLALATGSSSGLWYPLDDPVAKAKGIMPPTVVKVVMKIGRIRSFPEAMIASAVSIS